MEKKQYEKIKEIKRKISKQEKTTFAERNIFNMAQKKARKKLSLKPIIINF